MYSFILFLYTYHSIGFIYHNWSGTCLGIWFVLTGCVNGCLRYPKKYPRYTRGSEMPNHKHNNANIVLNGTAPELCFPHIKKFKKKQVVNTIPGKSVAVYNKLYGNIKNFFLFFKFYTSYINMFYIYQ